MATNNSLSGSFLFAVLKGLGIVLRALPFPFAVGFARLMGFAGYYFLSKKRRVAYANLKTVFGSTRSPQEIRRLVRINFQNLACSFVDLLYIPKIKHLGFEPFVTAHTVKNIDEALKRGKGVILLALHSGSWELASIVGSVQGHPYNMVANAQPKAPLLDAMLNEYRAIAGTKVLAPGFAIRGVVKALRANEVVTLVLDQGGRDGMPISFLGKTASMSTGAVRLALEYGAAIVPAWITRRPNGHNDLTFYPALELVKTGDMEKDIQENMKMAVEYFEPLVRNYPDEYLWFYKVYKYTTQTLTVILDDGRTGHLRQSETIARLIKEGLCARGKQSNEVIVPIVFKGRWAKKGFAVFSVLAQAASFLRDERFLRFFLTPESYRALMSHKPDHVVSCGSAAGRVNFIYAFSNQAKSISILKSGLLGMGGFDLSILPQHDKPAAGASNGRSVFTKAAPNLITPGYLKEQETGLLAKYPHLKTNVRLKIGVLLGGNTKGVVYDPRVIRSLLHHLKEAASHFNADLLVTTSRRTPADVDVLVSAELRNFEHCPVCIIANEQNIPQAVGGILALSDITVVSGESISMVSESLSSGKKTIVFAPQGSYGATPRDKYDVFVLGLHDAGYLLAVSVKEMSAALHDMVQLWILNGLWVRRKNTVNVF